MNQQTAPHAQLHGQNYGVWLQYIKQLVLNSHKHIWFDLGWEALLGYNTPPLDWALQSTATRWVLTVPIPTLHDPLPSSFVISTAVSTSSWHAFPLTGCISSLYCNVISLSSWNGLPIIQRLVTLNQFCWAKLITLSMYVPHMINYM